LFHVYVLRGSFYGNAVCWNIGMEVVKWLGNIIIIIIIIIIKRQD